MGIFFSGNELLQIALGMEKRGKTFYESLSKKSKQPKVKAVWDYLAGEERKHLKTFGDLLDSLRGGAFSGSLRRRVFRLLESFG